MPTAPKRAVLSIIAVLLFCASCPATPGWWCSIDPASDPLFSLLDDDLTSRPDTVLSRLYDLCDATANKHMQARTLYFDAYINGRTNLPEALTRTQRALSLVDSVAYQYDYYRLMALHSSILVNMGNYLDAFKILSVIAPYFDAIGDTRRSAVIYGNTGLIYLLIDDYDEAHYYLTKAQHLFQLNGNLQAYLLSCQQLAFLYEKTGRVNEARTLLRDIIDNYSDAHPSIQEIRYYCIVSYFKLIDDPAQQRLWLDRLCATALETDNWQCRMNALKNKASWFYDNNVLDSALYYARITYTEAQTRCLAFAQEGDIYRLLSQIYGSLGRWQDAYNFHLKADSYQDSIRSVEMRTDIEKEKIRREIARNAMRLHELEVEKRQSALLYTIITVSLTLLLILLTVIIYLIRKRAQERRRLFEIEKKALTGQVEAQNREISSDKLLSVSRLKTMEELSSYIRQMQSQKQIDNAVANVILGKIRETVKRDDDWENFKRHFDEVHPSFFKKLRELHPSLTENERKLCAYYKMGISNKQVALMLSVQPKSVIISRYRIHKKMNLPKDVSLNDYIETL